MQGTPIETFGTRLRELRERTQPEDIGLRDGGRRRVPGLRREELATFANLSADYVTRLEQGSARSPSPDVVTALARALRLSRLEASLLHHLAGHAAPTDLEVPQFLSPGVHRIIDRLDATPVAAYDATWTLIAANGMWRELRGSAESQPGYNLVRAVFMKGADEISQDVEYRERLQRSLAADLRIGAARYPTDSRMQTLLRDMISSNLAFAVIWAEGQARPFEAEPKRLAHSELGDIWLDCDVLTSAEGDTRLVIYTAAPGSSGDIALRSLARSTQG